mgnify:FL=1
MHSSSAAQRVAVNDAALRDRFLPAEVLVLPLIPRPIRLGSTQTGQKINDALYRSLRRI